MLWHAYRQHRTTLSAVSRGWTRSDGATIRHGSAQEALHELKETTGKHLGADLGKRLVRTSSEDVRSLQWPL